MAFCLTRLFYSFLRKIAPKMPDRDPTMSHCGWLHKTLNPYRISSVNIEHSLELQRVQCDETVKQILIVIVELYIFDSI